MFSTETKLPVNLIEVAAEEDKDKISRLVVEDEIDTRKQTPTHTTHPHPHTHTRRQHNNSAYNIPSIQQKG